MSDYKFQLDKFIKERILAIAPNFVKLVGEITAAKLIAQAGSLINLAKQPNLIQDIIEREELLRPTPNKPTPGVELPDSGELDTKKRKRTNTEEEVSSPKKMKLL